MVSGTLSASMIINSSNIKRLIYIGLAAFFVTRVYTAGVKLIAQDVGYSQKIITEDPQGGNSIDKICAQ